MKLSEREKEVLILAQHSSKFTFKELAARLGCQEHSARHSLKKLLDNGILHKMPIINHSQLGLNQFHLYLSPLPQVRGHWPQILETILETPQVSGVMECSGDYQYVVTFLANDPQEVLNFLYTLSNSFGSWILRKRIGIFTSWTFFGRNYLVSKNFNLEPIVSKRVGSVRTIDKLDFKILNLLWSRSELSRRELAQNLQLSLSTLDYRINRLEEDGILVRQLYSIREPVFQTSIYRLLLHTSHNNREFSESLMDYARHNDHIVAAQEILGAWDYEFRLEFLGDNKINAHVDELYRQFPAAIQEIEVLQVVKVHIAKFPLISMREFIEAA